MLGMAAIAKPMILILIGEKWSQSILYLQILCFVGMFYPLHAINLNMLQIQGRSDLFLKLEVIKKILTIPTIIIGIYFGIKIMIIGMIINTIIAFFINSYWSGKMIDYSFKQQVSDIIPSFLLALGMSFTVFILGKYLSFPNLLLLPIQVFTGMLIIVIYCEFVQFRDYIFMKNIIKEKISIYKKEKKYASK
jgi:O-antigen/teichoic acid export membrane protein